MVGSGTPVYIYIYIYIVCVCVCVCVKTIRIVRFRSDDKIHCPCSALGLFIAVHVLIFKSNIKLNYIWYLKLCSGGTGREMEYEV